MAALKLPGTVGIPGSVFMSVCSYIFFKRFIHECILVDRND